MGVHQTAKAKNWYHIACFVKTSNKMLTMPIIHCYVCYKLNAKSDVSKYQQIPTYLSK